MVQGTIAGGRTPTSSRPSTPFPTSSASSSVAGPPPLSPMSPDSPTSPTSPSSKSPRTEKPATDASVKTGAHLSDRAPSAATLPPIALLAEAESEIIEFVKSLTLQQTAQLDPNVFTSQIIRPEMLKHLRPECWPKLPCDVLAVLTYKDVSNVLRQISEGKKTWLSLSIRQRASLAVDKKKVEGITASQQAFAIQLNPCFDSNFAMPAESLGALAPQAHCVVLLHKQFSPLPSTSATSPTTSKVSANASGSINDAQKILKDGCLRSNWKKFKDNFIPKTLKGKIILGAFALLCVVLVIASCLACWPAYAAAIAGAIGGPAVFLAIIVLIKVLAILLLTVRDLISHAAYGNRNDVTRLFPGAFASTASGAVPMPIHAPNP